MSRIGKRPIEIPKGVEVKINDATISIKGPKGTLAHVVHESMAVAVDGGNIVVTPKEASLKTRRFHGLSRTLIQNMVTGVSQGYSKSLSLVGVGYRAAIKGKGITLSLGYSHPIDFEPPKGIEIKVPKLTDVEVHGADKEMVGRIAAKIRSFRPPEPYHGKGVRYTNEVIATKVGKSAGKK